jgi:hypothetical protein
MRFLALLLLISLSSAAAADTNIYARNVTISTAQDDAERNCCYYGRYKIVEKGVAYSPSRRGWFAVIRYGN